MNRAAILATVLLAAGCIPIPPSHVGDTRGNLSDDAAKWIARGRTTRADTNLHFGEPDGGIDGCGNLWWEALDRRGGGLLMIPGPGGGVMAMAGASVMRLRRLIVWFDAEGHASGSLLQTGYCHIKIVGFATATGQSGSACLPPIPPAP
jgi:hypothetical protein